MELLARTCHMERLMWERLFARVFTAAGGLFWILMVFTSNTAARYSNLSYTVNDVTTAAGSALLPFVITAAVFILGLFYERLAGVLLFAGAAGTIAWGITAGWGAGLWVSMGVLLAAPMLVAATLFMLAANMQATCDEQTTNTA